MSQGDIQPLSTSSRCTSWWPRTTTSTRLLEQLLVRRGHHVQLANEGRKALSLAEDGVLRPAAFGRPHAGTRRLPGHSSHSGTRRSSGGHLPVIALTAGRRRKTANGVLQPAWMLFWPSRSRLRTCGRRSTGSFRKDEGGRIKDEIETPAGSGSSFTLHPSSFGAGLPERPVRTLDGLRRRCCHFEEHLSVVPGWTAGSSDGGTRCSARAGQTARLSEAAHKICGMVAAFSTVAGGVASDLEDRAAQGHLDEARLLVGRPKRWPRNWCGWQAACRLKPSDSRQRRSAASDHWAGKNST